MAQPYNYTLDLPNPTQNLMQAINIKSAVDQQRQQEASAQQAAQSRAQLQADLAALGPNASPAALSQLMVKYPQMSEEFKRTYDVLDSEQQKSRVSQASQVYAALEANQPEMAQRLLTEQADAYRNSGMEREAKTLEDLAELTRVSPETAKTSTGLFLASSMGPEKFTETFTKLQGERREAQLAPEQLSEAQSKARQAAVKADFAESQAVLDLQKKGWDIYKIQEDAAIARENSRIAAMKAQLAKEQNELKRAELNTKIADAQRKRDETLQAKVADAESARGNIDNMLNNVDRILQLPAGTIDDSVGAWDGSWIGGVIDTFDQDVQNFKALMENLDAQAFLAQVPQMKGLGALSENEGKKLGAALQSFNTKQSEAQFIANLKETQRLMMKARENLATRYGIPDTVADTPAVETSPEDIQALLQKYGGGQ